MLAGEPTLLYTVDASYDGDGHLPLPVEENHEAMLDPSWLIANHEIPQTGPSSTSFVTPGNEKASSS